MLNTCPCCGVEQYTPIGNALCVFRPKNWLRRQCVAFVQHPWFDNTVLGLILVSSILLATDTPLQDPHSTYSAVLWWADVILTGLFTLEMMVKVVMRGFLFGPVRVGWCHVCACALRAVSSLLVSRFPFPLHSRGCVPRKHTCATAGTCWTL